MSFDERIPGNKNILPVILITLHVFCCCTGPFEQAIPEDTPYLVVLGIAQDGGYPQTACDKDCCKEAWLNPELRRMVVCLGIVDPATGNKWLIDATPDIKEQINRLKLISGTATSAVNGIFLTHAHIGHYTGLMQFGHEAIGATEMPVYAMPRMKRYLSSSGPWDQLVRYRNIRVVELAENEPVVLTHELTVTPFLVPHRDEYSETVGYRIKGPHKSVIYIPDINKWEIWDKDINNIIQNNDLLFIDGSFYNNGEIEGRDMSDFPHPFIEESITRFESLSYSEKQKVFFIHLNHTNPAIHDIHTREEINKSGFRVASQFQIVPL